LEYKVERAMEFRGARYVHVHVPCPLGWGSEPKDTIRIARLAIETGLFPLFEAENGKITERTQIREVRPVEDYLRLQKRFAHLFKPGANHDWIAGVQQIANKNIEEFGLMSGGESWQSRSGQH
jgi:pyruvate ferredoxin oxidoreductase beta subunit